MSNENILRIYSSKKVDDLMVSLNFYPISKFQISQRCKNILADNGINSVGDLICLTKTEAESLKGVGRKSFTEIHNELLLHGLDFSPVSQSSMTRPRIVSLEILLHKLRQIMPNTAIHDKKEVNDERN